MNKAELINEYQRVCKVLAIPSQQIILGAGGALMMLGLREQTQDLDLSIPPEVFTALCAASPERAIEKSATLTVFAISSLTDLHAQDTDWEIEQTEGVWHLTAEALLAQKLSLNRPKDQQDILNLQGYLCLF